MPAMRGTRWLIQRRQVAERHDGLGSVREGTRQSTGNIGAWRYVVKCDDCKVELRRTGNVKESYAGGHCDACRKVGQVIAKSQIKR